MANKITKISITNDKISGRGGLSLFLRYVEQIGLYRLISGSIITRPQVIELGVDTMVLDNDGARRREGSEVTYKRKKAFSLCTFVGDLFW